MGIFDYLIVRKDSNMVRIPFFYKYETFISK